MKFDLPTLDEVIAYEPDGLNAVIPNWAVVRAEAKERYPNVDPEAEGNPDTERVLDEIAYEHATGMWAEANDRLSALEFPLTVYRAFGSVSLKEINQGMYAERGAGIFWSWDENNAYVHKELSAGHPHIVILRGVIQSPNDVNVLATAWKNLVAEDEREIEVRPGAKIQVTGYKWKGEKGWRKPPQALRSVTADVAEVPYASPGQFIYHVTYLKNLDNIAANGLTPNAESGIGGPALQGHKTGKVFLTDAGGVNFWLHRAETFAYHSSDDLREEGLVPVVLRMREQADWKLKLDDVGTDDSGHEAFMYQGALPADDIEVWNGKSWDSIYSTNLNAEDYFDEEGYLQDTVLNQPKFGSQFKGFTNEGMYLGGRCHVFALALHRAFGLDMMMYWDDDPEYSAYDDGRPELSHAVGVTKSGKMFDARGAVTQQQVENEYMNNSPRWEKISEEDLLSIPDLNAPEGPEMESLVAMLKKNKRKFATSHGDESSGVPEHGMKGVGGQAYPKLRRETMFEDEAKEEGGFKNAATKPRFLYHGTPKANLDDILKNGLKAEASESHIEWTKAVYLACNPETAASYAGHKGAGKDWVVLQIDTTKLNAENLRPDDYDFPTLWEGGSMWEESNIPAEIKAQYDNWALVPWDISLQYTCQVAYLGDVPPGSITVLPSKSATFKTADAESYYVGLDEVARSIISEYENNLTNPGYRQKWGVVPSARLKKIWNDYAKTGMVRDEKGMADIAWTVQYNIWKIHVNTILCGHTEQSPMQFAESVMGEDLQEKYGRDIFQEDDNSFFDDDKGAWRLSDYALEPLVNAAGKLENAKTAEQQLQAVDAILNIVHARSDLASWFVQGGTATLNSLAGYEKIKTKGKTSGAQFLPFAAWVKKNGGIAKLLGEYDVDTAETYGDGLEEPDSPTAAKRYEKELHKRALADFQSRYENLIAEYQRWNFPMDVFRCISLPSNSDPAQQHLFPGTPQAKFQQALNEIKYRGVGIYWSWDENAAECHWGSGGPSVTLHGVIHRDNIDWEGTIYANMFPSLGDEEKEVRLIEGTQFELEEIQYDKKTGWSQPPMRTVTAKENVPGQVYLLHFDIDPSEIVPSSRPDATSGKFHARHYLGWALVAQDRIDEHYKNQSGVKLIDAVHAAGITFTVARIWDNVTRDFERKLKNQGGLSRHCPICKKLGLDRDSLYKKRLQTDETEEQVAPATPDEGPDFVEKEKIEPK